MMTAYSQSFVNLTHAKGNEILESLSELPNFFPWEMLERQWAVAEMVLPRVVCSCTVIPVLTPPLDAVPPGSGVAR